LSLGAGEILSEQHSLSKTINLFFKYSRGGSLTAKGRLRWDAFKVITTPSTQIQKTRPQTMKTIPIQILPMDHYRGLSLPTYATDQSAGMDLRAAVPADKPVVLHPGDWHLIPVGIAIALPNGFEAQVRPRSGLAAKHGISCVNTPGTVDADYRGEIRVNLINHGKADFIVNRGDRIAQMIIAPVIQAVWDVREELDETARGTGGFGSTGI
jgi:dUTP pyrophosphatase